MSYSKYYGVTNGRDGPFCIYTDWSRVTLATTKKKESKFKKFKDESDCLKWMNITIDHPQLKLLYGNIVTPKRKLSDIYTDGGCVDNGTPYAVAGLGVWLGEGDDLNHVSIPLPGRQQTNNRAELLAAILGVLEADKNDPVVIHTDSMYTINASTIWCPKWLEDPEFQGWSKTENWDLIHLLYIALQDRPNVTLKYIKAHSGLKGNEMADELATRAIKKSKLKRLCDNI